MSNKKILLLSYSISPYRGSEFSVGWNYVTHMSEDNEIILLYGTSNGEFNNTKEIDDYIKENEFKNVKFVPIKIKDNFLNKFLLFILKNGLGSHIPFYFLYKGWHKQAYKKAEEIISNEEIDIIHCLNPIGFKEPGYLWKLNKPYIWGPITAVHNRPKSLLKNLTLKQKISSYIRDIVLSLTFKYNRRVAKTIKRADVVLCATTESQKQVKEHFNKECYYISENGISKIEDSVPISLSKEQKIQFIWIGSICTRKNLGLLLDALSSVESNLWELNVIGSGELYEDMKKKSSLLGLNNHITWHGNIARDEVQKILSLSHLHIITSLGEGNPTVIWEAMSKGIPTMTLDHCGMHDTICEKCGIKIPIQTYKEVVENIGLKLNEVINNPQIITELSKETISCAEKFSWEKRHIFFNKIYDDAIANFNNKN